MSNIIQRTITGAIFIMVVIGSVLLGNYYFAALFFIVNILGLLEFYSLLQKNGMHVQKISGIILGSVVYIYFFYLQKNIFYVGYLVLFPVFFLLIFSIELFRNRQNPFSNIAHTLLGVMYISFSLSLFILLPYSFSYYFSYQYFIIIGYFVILWTSDTAAYLVGSRFGKHRLFERVSPKKSWEGAIGGLIFGILAAFILSKYYPQLSVSQWMIVGFVIIVTGIIGDLIESLFKRSMHVKDTGNLLPGHGGILDRFDALFFSAPFVFVTVYLLTH